MHHGISLRVRVRHEFSMAKGRAVCLYACLLLYQYLALSNHVQPPPATVWHALAGMQACDSGFVHSQRNRTHIWPWCRRESAAPLS
jgi:hypothetical protein